MTGETTRTVRSNRHDPHRHPTPPFPSDEDHEDWVDAWRMAVRRSVLPVALIELPETWLVELSPAAAHLLAVARPNGKRLAMTTMAQDHEQVATAAHALSSGAVDAFHAQRRLRRPDGSFVAVSVFCRAIRSGENRNLALWVASEPDRDLPVDASPATVDGSAMPFSCRAALVGRLSPDWRFETVEAEMEEFLGYPTDALVGTVVFDHVHPTDLPRFLLALAEATSTREVTLELRLRHRHEGWRTARALVLSPDHDAQRRFFVGLEETTRPPHANGESRVRELERHLLRIAQEIQVAGLLPPVPGATIPDLAHLAELSARQREILVCLARGYRVPRIAQELYLSESTVRNHLSAIFKRFGVHSQDELLRIIAVTTEPVPR